VLDAVAERIVAVEDGTLRSYPGGWADYARIRADEDAPTPPKQRTEKEKPERPKPQRPSKRPSELEQIETSIQARELELAELEQRLAEDWGDVETLAAHKVARDDLQGLLERWEQLFESAQQA
jgi:ATPase subunit of ABC transporter with duplicated ATPase domains